MFVNKHLLKKKPLYIASGYIIKLLRAFNTDKGLMFTAEIMEGEYKGLWTTVYKNDTKKIITKA